MSSQSPDDQSVTGSCYWSVHRDRRKIMARISFPLMRWLTMLLVVNTVGVTLVKGCRVAKEDGSIHCQLRAFTSEWSSGVSRAEQESAPGLWIECVADASTYPTALPVKVFAAFSRLEWLHLESCRLSELPTGSLIGPNKLRKLRIQSISSSNSLNDMSEEEQMTNTPLLTSPSTTSLTLSDQVLDHARFLDSLDLAFNDIRTLPGSSICSLRELVHLNLTSNLLVDLQWLGCMTTHSPLKVLDVSNNRLVTLPAKSLTNLTHLEELHLQGNRLTNLDDQSLDGLKSLRLINLAGNQLSSLPPGLLSSAATHLTEVYVSANSLSVLAPRLFHGLSQLLVLDLSENQLTASSFGPTTLSGLSRLAVLSLHNNRIARLDVALLSDLTNLQILRLDGNLLESIPDGIFASLPHLHTLILSRNRLSRLDGQLLANLPSLSILALDNNLIERIEPEAFANTTHLQDLNLSGNYLPAVPVALTPLIQLQSLDLGENRIVGFDHNVVAGMKELSSLRLLDNHIGNISRSTFASLPSLRILNLSKNQISSVEEGAFSQNLLLQAVRFDANELTDLSGLFHSLPNLVWLNVSDNRLAHFDYSLIPKSLQWLDMHLNHIPELGNYFQLDDQLSLQTLDASFNRLTELTASMLPDSLQVLSLNDNLISSVQPYTFFRKDNLTRVDLYANHISDLDQNALRVSPATDGRPLPEFYIGGNPFQCDCNM